MSAGGQATSPLRGSKPRPRLLPRPRPLAAPHWAVHLLLATVGGLALHLWVAAGTDPVPDETWYALWSRHLGVAYPDHPPAIAWSIATARWVLGESKLALRLPALLAGAAVPLLLAAAAARLAGPKPAGSRAAVRTVWLASGTLFLHVLGVIVTPDVPLVLAWSAALAGAAAALARARTGRRVPAAALLGLGVLGGLAILSKLHGWLLLAGLVGGLGWAGAVRPRRLAWIAVGALAVAAPGWTAALRAPAASDAAFQLARLRPAGVPGVHVPGLLAGQLALLTPVIGLLAAGWLVRALRRRSDADRLLLALAVPTLAAFAAAAVLRPVEANWPAPGWLAVVVGLGLRELGRWRRPAIAVSVPVVLAAHLLAVTGLPGIAGRPPGRDPAARLHGWSALGPAVSAACAGGPVVAEGYWLGAEARWWAPGCDVRIVDGRRAAWIRAAGLAPAWTPGGPASPTADPDPSGADPSRADGTRVLHRADRPAPRPPGCEAVPGRVVLAGGRRLRVSTLRCARASTRRLDDTAPRSAPP